MGLASYDLISNDAGWRGRRSPATTRRTHRRPAMYRSSLAVASLIVSISSVHAESGLASYYGGRGHRGEMTCAHRTLPFGRMVTVTSAGRSRKKEEIRCRRTIAARLYEAGLSMCRSARRGRWA